MTKILGLPQRPYFDDADVFDFDHSKDEGFGVPPWRDRDDRDHDDRGHHDDDGDEHISPLPYDAAAFPDGVSSGDVTQTSAVLWTRATRSGHRRLELAPSFAPIKAFV